MNEFDLNPCNCGCETYIEYDQHPNGIMVRCSDCGNEICASKKENIIEKWNAENNIENTKLKDDPVYMRNLKSKMRLKEVMEGS